MPLYVQTECFHRGSDSCCLLPALRPPILRCCFWMRSPPIWTPKPKPECLLHCAALPGDAPCCPFLIVFMKIWVEEPCILEKVTHRIWKRGCMEREPPPYQRFECAEYARFVSFIRRIVYWRQSDSTAFTCINDADNFATKTVYDLFRYQRYNRNSRLCLRNLRLHDWHIIYVCM